MEVEPLTLRTNDGLALEAELVVPDFPVAGAVLTHPHPRHGGNMRSMVPGELITALPSIDVATLRFNFRGMGASEGTFENGVGERLDTIAAVGTLFELVEGLPLVVCGSSFGADTALTVDDERISAWCALAPPLRDERFDQMANVARSAKPKHLVVADRDKIRSADAAAELTKGWNNTSIHTVSGADHFFVGRIDEAIASCVGFVSDLTQSPPE